MIMVTHLRENVRDIYNKLLLDHNSIPTVSRQTLTRWSKYGKSINEKNKITNHFPHFK